MNFRLACGPAVRTGAALAILAAPAAAGVDLRLDGPREPLGSRQAFTLEAVVTGAGDETGVLWSASEVIEGEVGRTCRGIWPWDPEVRFRPDGPGGRASFAAPGRAGGLRTFQIRAASMKDPRIFRCVRIEVRSDADAPAETKSQDGSTTPEGKAGAAAASSRQPGLAWETPFRLGSMGLDDEFQPAVFRFHEGQPCLVGEYRRRQRGHYFPARVGPDNSPQLLQDPGLEPVYRPSGVRGTLDCLPDGSAVLVGRTPMRIYKIDPEGRPVALAGTGQPPEDGAQAGAGLGGPAQEACLRVVGRLTAGQDGSVAWFDGNASQIRRVTREGILEALAGGGEGPVFTGDGQDLEQERPALGVRLVQPAAMVAGPDQSLVFCTAARGLFALAADGVLHRLMAPSDAGLVTVTEDDRVVFTEARGFGARECGMLQVGPGREPVPLATFLQGDGEAGPLVASPSFPLGVVRRMMPAPGGGLLVTTQGRNGVWYLGRPGGDQELARMVDAVFAAVRDAGQDRDLDLPWRCREALARVAGARPDRPGHLRDLRLAAVASGGKGLRAARNPEGKALAVLPDAVQHHVVSFLDDYPALVFRALIALHVLDRKLATLPGERLAGFLAHRPAGVPAETEGESKGGTGDL